MNKVDNARTENKNVVSRQESSSSAVSDLNKKNIDKVSAVTASDNYCIPYGDSRKSSGSGEAASKRDSTRSIGGVSKDNATKNMHPMFQPRPKPPDYDEAWYEDPTDGQWYNQYDWYEDEMGEWAYDYRMEEYGYMQNELGEWVPMEEPDQNGAVPSNKQSSTDKPPSDQKKSTTLDRGNSKDGFSQLFQSGSDKSVNNKSSLPPRPIDYDDYWYQAEDGNWYNEYDDMGLQFSDPKPYSRPASLVNAKDVPKKEEVSKAQARPTDYDQQWYQDEFGVRRNKYDDKSVEEEDDYYTEEQLVKIEEKLKNESKESQSKVDFPKAVEPKLSVIAVSKDKPKDTVTSVDNDITKKKKLPKPADFEDQWYQDYDGNWQNSYLKDGLEYEDAVPPSILTANRDSPLKKVKQKVSFESSASEKSQSKSGRTPKERWLWAYSKIVKVGDQSVNLSSPNTNLYCNSVHQIVIK